jgi:riboflavin kinase/FMN adenylyltransferase
MKIFEDIEFINCYDCVATIGFFDGVHLGHRFLLNELTKIARKKQKTTLVITFDTHPQEILKRRYAPPILTTKNEKLQLLEEFGIDNCLVLNFTDKLAEYSAYDFFSEILLKKLHIDTLLVGYDHRFGKNRAETFEDYLSYGKKLGIHVIQAKPFSENDKHFSSSEIRRFLEQGNVAAANKILGYRYHIKGIVTDGEKIGKRIGFPTANLNVNEIKKLIPATGVYAVTAKLDNKTYKGMLNIGWRPTLGKSDEKTIEVHIIGFEGNIYTETLQIAFVQRIRDEIKFKNIEELVIQLKKDKEFVLSLIL